MDALIYLANALHLLSYLMRDILHLRILMITAMLWISWTSLESARRAWRKAPASRKHWIFRWMIPVLGRKG